MEDGIIEVRSYKDPREGREVYTARSSYHGFPLAFTVFLYDNEARALNDPGSEIRARLRAAYDAKVAELIAVA